MSFSLFLNEGLIKLPPKLIGGVTKYFVYWYLAFLQSTAEADKSHDEDDLDMIKLGVDRLAKKYGVKPPSDADIKKSKTTRAIYKNFDVEDIPQSYLARVAEIHGPEAIDALKKANVKFVVAFKEHPKIDHDGDFPQGIFYPDPPEIIISIPNMNTRLPTVIKHLSQFNVAEAARRLDYTIGIVEHEVTHAVQSMVLYLLHPKQYDKVGKSAQGLDSNQAKQEKYYTSQLEFDPWVKTSIKELKALFGRKKVNDVASKKELFKYFTFSDVQPTEVSNVKDDHVRSDFFKALRRSDLVKWKRAIKLIAQEVL